MKRWKKHPRETGLRAVGAGPYRASTLRDGDQELATVYPLGGDWRMPLRGWYFVVNHNGQHANTCHEPAETEQEAKAAAVAFLKSVGV